MGWMAVGSETPISYFFSCGPSFRASPGFRSDTKFQRALPVQGCCCQLYKRSLVCVDEWVVVSLLRATAPFVSMRAVRIDKARNWCGVRNAPLRCCLRCACLPRLGWLRENGAFGAEATETFRGGIIMHWFAEHVVYDESERGLIGHLDPTMPPLPVARRPLFFLAACAADAGRERERPQGGLPYPGRGCELLL